MLFNSTCNPTDNIPQTQMKPEIIVSVVSLGIAVWALALTVRQDERVDAVHRTYAPQTNFNASALDILNDHSARIRAVSNSIRAVEFLERLQQGEMAALTNKMVWASDFAAHSVTNMMLSALEARRVADILTDHNARIHAVTTNANYLKIAVNLLLGESVILPQLGGGFVTVATDFGPLFIVTESITPHLDGYAAELKICNPASVHFTGAKVTLSAGDKSSVTHINTPLPSGEWFRVKCVIAPCSAEEMRKVLVRISASGIRPASK
jgi:hypothetical protein